MPPRRTRDEQDIANLRALIKRTAVAESGTVREQRTITANATLVSNDSVVFIDATSGDITVTLVNASAGGKQLDLIRTDSSGNTVTIDPFSTQTISGQATRTIAVGGSMSIISDGSNWWMS